MKRCKLCNGRIWPMQWTTTSPTDTKIYHRDCFENWNHNASLEEMIRTLRKALTLPPSEAVKFLKESKHVFKTAKRQSKQFWKALEKQEGDLLLQLARHTWKEWGME